MGLSKYTEVEFVELLNEAVSPSSPVIKLQLLKGRAEQVEQINRAFHTVGRHVFIYGDRGVGKSSLAFSMAHYLSNAEVEPIILAANRQTFDDIVFDLLRRLKKLNGERGQVKRRVSLGVDVYNASYETEEKQSDSGESYTLNRLIELLVEQLEKLKLEPVVVIDEFDQLQSKEDKIRFADFIKQLGDQKLPLKVFFTGIGKSIRELLTGHHSCFRYLAAIELEPIGWDGRFEIIDSVGDVFEIDIDRETSVRIAAISDGFPHYIHLICQHLLWVLYDQSLDMGRETVAFHYKEAVARAVKDVAPELQETYEKATRKYNTDYEEILWAVADLYETPRASKDIYQSYLEIMKEIDKTPQSRSQYNTKMNALKKPSHGEILHGTRTGWYEFSEPFIMGYVRLRAERMGVELAKDHPMQTGARPHKYIR